MALFIESRFRKYVQFIKQWLEQFQIVLVTELVKQKLFENFEKNGKSVKVNNTVVEVVN